MDYRFGIAAIGSALIAVGGLELAKRAYAKAGSSVRQFFRHTIVQQIIAGVVGSVLLTPPLLKLIYGTPLAALDAKPLHADVQRNQQGDDAAAHDGVDQLPVPEGDESTARAVGKSVVAARSAEGFHVLNEAAHVLRQLDVAHIGIVLGGTIRRDDAYTADVRHYSVRGQPYPAEQADAIP